MSNSIRKPASSVVPQLLQLESRDVPATFYVDPTVMAADGTSNQTFNAGQPNQKAGLIFSNSSATAGATLFGNFKAAFAKSEATPGADTIMLANGKISVDNSTSVFRITQDLSITGSGRDISTLVPTSNNTSYDPGNINDQDVGLFEAVGGLNFNVSQLGLDGAGKSIGIGFYVEASKATFDRVSIANIAFPSNLGTSIFATKGSELTVTSSGIANYGREGITALDSKANVSGSSIFGIGTNTGNNRVNYGVQYQGGAQGVLSGNTFAFNQAIGDSEFQSAAVLLTQDITSPNVTIENNGFVSNTWGVVVGTSRGNDNSVALLRSNFFATSNVVGVIARNNLEVDAKYNFWGARNGPNDVAANGKDAINPYGQGTSVDSFVNWYFYYDVPASQYVEKEYAAASTTSDNKITLQSENSGFAPRLTVSAFDGKFNGVRNVAAGDFNGDGVQDIAVSQGPGATSTDRVQIFNGATGAVIADFGVFGNSAYTGGVSLALGDVNGDGKDDLIVSPQSSGGPSVRIYNAASFKISDFFAFEGPAVFSGGVSVASNDVDSDGYDDIVVGAGKGGNSRFQVFGGRFITTGTGAKYYNINGQAFANEGFFAGEVYVAAGDFNGDGRADIVISAGNGGDGRYRVFSSNIDGTTGGLIGDNKVVSGLSSSASIRVAARDIDGDLRDDLIFGIVGLAGDSKVRSNYLTDLVNPPAVVGGNLYPGSTSVIVG